MRKKNKDSETSKLNTRCWENKPVFAPFLSLYPLNIRPHTNLPIKYTIAISIISWSCHGWQKKLSFEHDPCSWYSFVGVPPLEQDLPSCLCAREGRGAMVITTFMVGSLGPKILQMISKNSAGHENFMDLEEQARRERISDVKIELI
jgi:hypothetical protein